MTFDGFVLAALTAELKSILEGGKIQGVRQHNSTDFTIEIRSRAKSYPLFLSVHPRFARIHLTASKQAVPKEAPSFCMLLRKHLVNSFITQIEQTGFDRLLKIHTEAPDGNRNVLVLELMGRHSNLILHSDTGKILGAAKNITAAVSRFRQVLPGRDYEPPPGGEKASILNVTKNQFEALWKDVAADDISNAHVTRWLIAAFSGIGPFLADEIMLSAGTPDSETVWTVIQEIKRIVSESDFQHRLITDDRGKALYAYPMPVLQFPSSNQHQRFSMNETLDTLYRDLLHRDDFDSQLSSLEGGIRKSVAYREQLLRDLGKAIKEGEQSERYKEYGDLILANRTAISKGQKVARVKDYYDPDMQEVDIPLDEKQTPQENAERYFRRFRKARDGARAAADRITEAINESTILKSALESLTSMKTVEELRTLRETLSRKGLLRPEPRVTAPGKREVAEFGSARIRRVVSMDGFEILYGENSTSNDYLTGKVARPNDMWFHARSVTGAHVVVRTGGRDMQLPPSTIRQAAEIAALNSDAKHSSLVPVDYTQRKFVRKPRGAAPGLVTYQREKTIDVTPASR
jgi:predicted ribosome quality control (RQC) complex YloA/Tae2 family protein